MNFESFNHTANAIVLDDVCHADVLPNPVGGRNAKLLGCSWYADKLDEDTLEIK